MKVNTRGILALLIFFCANVGVMQGEDVLDLTLGHSDWKVRPEAVLDSKKADGLSFDEELIFKDGTLTTPRLQKQGFGPATYHSGGIETFLEWGCDQKNTGGEKIVWEGIADRQHRGAWMMDGSIVRTFPDGRVYKQRFKGKGAPLPNRSLKDSMIILSTTNAQP